MQNTDRQATDVDTKQSVEQQPRGPQPIDAALLRSIGGGIGEPPSGTPGTESPKGGW